MVLPLRQALAQIVKISTGPASLAKFPEEPKPNFGAHTITRMPRKGMLSPGMTPNVEPPPEETLASGKDATLGSSRNWTAQSTIRTAGESIAPERRTPNVIPSTGTAPPSETMPLTITDIEFFEDFRQEMIKENMSPATIAHYMKEIQSLNLEELNDLQQKCGDNFQKMLSSLPPPKKSTSRLRPYGAPPNMGVGGAKRGLATLTTAAYLVAKSGLYAGATTFLAGKKVVDTGTKLGLPISTQVGIPDDTTPEIKKKIIEAVPIFRPLKQGQPYFKNRGFNIKHMIEFNCNLHNQDLQNIAIEQEHQNYISRNQNIFNKNEERFNEAQNVRINATNVLKSTINTPPFDSYNIERLTNNFANAIAKRQNLCYSNADPKKIDAAEKEIIELKEIIESRLKENGINPSIISNLLNELKTNADKEIRAFDITITHLNNVTKTVYAHFKDSSTEYDISKIAVKIRTNYIPYILIFLALTAFNFQKIQAKETNDERDVIIRKLLPIPGRFYAPKIQSSRAEAIRAGNAYLTDKKLRNEEYFDNFKASVGEYIKKLMPSKEKNDAELYENLNERFFNFTDQDYKDCFKSNISTFMKDNNFIKVLNNLGINPTGSEKLTEDEVIKKLIETSKTNPAIYHNILDAWQNSPVEELTILTRALNAIFPPPPPLNTHSAILILLVKSKLMQLEDNLIACFGELESDSNQIKNFEMIMKKHNLAWLIPPQLTEYPFIDSWTEKLTKEAPPLVPYPDF